MRQRSVRWHGCAGIDDEEQGSGEQGGRLIQSGLVVRRCKRSLWAIQAGELHAAEEVEVVRRRSQAIAGAVKDLYMPRVLKIASLVAPICRIVFSVALIPFFSIAGALASELGTRVVNLVTLLTLYARTGKPEPSESV